MSKNISAEALKGAFILGVRRLDAKKDIINDLNVFPVPDGDTGTNMSLTVNAALNEIENVAFDDVITLCKAISQGSLRGARGNSGVILSQLFRGFYKVIKTSEEVNVTTLSEALTKATETAYKAVMKPKEGTILTVAKAVSDRAEILCTETEDISEFYDGIVEAAKETLDKTPDMLPVLKQAGVVDSGGAGLLEILRGASDYISGRDTDLSPVLANETSEKESTTHGYQLNFTVISNEVLDSKSSSDLEVYIKTIGKISEFDIGVNSIKISCSTDEPGRVITRALKTGVISEINIKNTGDIPAILTDVPTAFSEDPKEDGFVAVATGDGMARIFTELGTDFCIKGGQTMNPSTEDILDAISNVNAKNVFVLPNNKNILLAAEQAAKLSEDKNVLVIPTKTLPQGICALINYIPDSPAKDNVDAMTDALNYISSGEVTYAVRDTIIDDKEIKKGDFMGIGDDGIKSVNKKIEACLIDLVNEISDEDSSLISLYYGADVKENEAEKMAKKLEKKFPDFEVELQNGGQPVYYYVLSVE